MSLSYKNRDINEAIRKRLMYTFEKIKYSNNAKTDEKTCQWYFDWTSITYEATGGNYVVSGFIWKNFGDKACSEVSVDILERAKADGISVERPAEKTDKSIGGVFFQELKVYFVDLRIYFEREIFPLQQINIELEVL